MDKEKSNIKNSLISVPGRFVLLGDKLSGSAWRVLMCILAYDYKHIRSGTNIKGDIIFKRKEKVWVSQETIARELGMPLRTVKWAVAQLKKVEFIESKRRFNNSNETYINYRPTQSEQDIALESGQDTAHV